MMHLRIFKFSRTIVTTGMCLSLLGGLGLTTAPDVAARSQTPTIPIVSLSQLPPEAKTTIILIQKGGPFPYPKKDGTVFSNFERRLPRASRGYYREYTVPTPGARNRGARRIVSGQQQEYYYTGDHYATFSRIQGITGPNKR
jgi:ribonuclease T1